MVTSQHGGFISKNNASLGKNTTEPGGKNHQDFPKMGLSE
jgi:hypothetical protein